MPRLTNPFTWAAELIDHDFSVPQALRRVAEFWANGDLGSNSATDGQVLTADGSGGTEWEDIPVADFYFEVAKGAVPGHSSINKFGTNTNIADGAEELVWSGSGAYTFSTTADITHIVSSAAETQTIEVQGLDANWAVVTQTKALTGTTGVALDTPLIRVFRMKVNDATTNAGVVQCGVGAVTSAFTVGNLRAQIDIGTGQTQMAIYTVPAGKTAYMTKYYGSMVGDPGPPARVPDYVIFRLYSTDNVNGYAPQLKHVVGAAMVGTSLVEHELQPAGGVNSSGEKTDIYITAQPEGDIGSASAGFDLVLVDDGF